MSCLDFLYTIAALRQIDNFNMSPVMTPIMTSARGRAFLKGRSGKDRLSLLSSAILASPLAYHDRTSGKVSKDYINMVLLTFLWPKTRYLDALFNKFTSGGFIVHEAN